MSAADITEPDELPDDTFICGCGKLRTCNRPSNARLLKRIHEAKTGHTAVVL